MSNSRVDIGWYGLLERPFARLVLHFIAAAFQSGQDSASTGLEIGTGAMLALLATPGAFVSMLLFDKYSSLLAYFRGLPRVDPYMLSFPDKYFFIVLAMTITAIVTVLKWDRIIPVRQDYFNLAPLPIATRDIFFASLAAMLVLAGAFAVDVNLGSIVLFPAVVMAERGSFPEFLRFAGVHALCVMLASAFAFFACFSIMAALMATLPARAFRRVSLYARVAIIVGSIALLCTSFAIPPLAARLPPQSDSWVRLLPPVWYTGLYQTLQGKASPALAALGRVGWQAAALAVVLALLSSAVSYRRYFLRIPETLDPAIAAASAPLWLSRLLDRILLRTGFDRACCRFVMKTLFRSESHSMFFAAFVGLGLVLASQTAVSAFASRRTVVLEAAPAADMLSIPLIVAFCMASGLRFVFAIPAETPANWVYQVSVDRGSHNARGVARKVMLAFLWPGIALPALAIYGWAYGWRIGLMHAAYVAVLCLLLSDVLLVRFRKIPFTCPLPSFRNNAVLMCFVWLIAAFVFAGLGAGLERWMMLRPVRYLILVPFLWAAWDMLWRIRREYEDVDSQLVFQDQPPAAIERLDLSGG